MKTSRNIFKTENLKFVGGMFELIIEARTGYFGLRVKKRSNGFESREIGGGAVLAHNELIEGDPGALNFNHAVVTDDDQVDGQVECIQRGVESADQGIYLEDGSLGFGSVRAVFVTGMVNVGVVEGDEVRTG